MALFNTAFGKVHFLFVLPIVLTIVLGVLLALAIPGYAVIANIHFITGLSIILLPLSALLLIKNGKMVLRAFRSRLRITKQDIAQKKPLIIVSKVMVNLLALSLLLQMITGIGMKTGVIVQLLPGFDVYGFHRMFMYIIPSLAVLHATTMKAYKLQAETQKRAKPMAANMK